MSPERGGDELEEGEDAGRASGGAGRFAVEEEGEQAEAEGVALFVETGKVSLEGEERAVTDSTDGERGLPSFEVLDPSHPLLGVGDHFTEEVSEAGSAQLGGSRSVEVSVVDCFAVGRNAETALGVALSRRRGLRSGELRGLRG